MGLFLNLLASCNKCPEVMLKLDHNILFILVYILTLEVSCVLFVTRWDYSFGTHS